MNESVKVEVRLKSIHQENWKTCKHRNAYKTAFGVEYCPDCDKNITRFVKGNKYGRK